MKKQLLLFFIFFLFLNTVKAQDPIFSQNLFTRTYLNPAIAGSDSTLNLSTGYRLQWYGIDIGTYSTTHFSADQYVRFVRGGIGLNIILDNANQTLKTNAINFNYAPHFELFHHKLAIQPGFSIGYFEKTIDWSQLTYGNEIDPQRGFVYNTNEQQRLSKKTNIDLSAGLFMYTKKIYGGIAVMHINEPDEGLLGSAKRPYKLTINAGANVSFKKDSNRTFTFSPNFIFQHQQNFSGILFGFAAKYKWFVLGINYRSHYAAIFNAGLQNRFIKIGYSYDYTTSLLTNATGGSHEIHLMWYIPYRFHKPCPIKTIRFI